MKSLKNMMSFRSRLIERGIEKDQQGGDDKRAGRRRSLENQSINTRQREGNLKQWTVQDPFPGSQIILK